MKLQSCQIVLFLAVASAAKLPSTFQKCNRKDANFNDCLTKAVGDAIHQLTERKKEVGLPSLEPLELPKLTIGAGTGAVNLQQNYKDVKVHGYSKPQINKFHLDLDKKTADFEFLFDEVTMASQYEANGKILLLPVYGDGPCTITLTKLKGVQHFDLEEYEKNGKKYLKVVKSKLNFNPELAAFNFENLFNGDKALGDNINKVINDSWREVFDDVKAGYEDAFAQINLNLANNVFSRVSIGELFES